MTSYKTGETGAALGKFATAIYLVAVLCMLAPPLDLILSLPTIDPESVVWRFGALGMLTGATIFPLVGLLLAFLTAVLCQHRIIYRALLGLGTIAVIGLTLAAGLFVLDAVQIRGQVPAAGKRRFDITVLKQALLQLFQLVTLILLLRGAWRANRLIAPARSDAGAPLIVTNPVPAGGRK